MEEFLKTSTEELVVCSIFGSILAKILKRNPLSMSSEKLLKQSPELFVDESSEYFLEDKL